MSDSSQFLSMVQKHHAQFATQNASLSLKQKAAMSGKLCTVLDCVLGNSLQIYVVHVLYMCCTDAAQLYLELLTVYN